MFHRKIWVALALTAAVVVTFGWWQEWDFSKTFVVAKKLTDQLQSSDISETASQGTQAAQDFLTEAVDQQKQTALASANKVRRSLTAGARQQAASAIGALEKTIGLEKVNIEPETGSSFIFVATVRVNELAYLMVKNKLDMLSDFLIDWGDNTQTTGILNPNEEKLISHSWQIVGDHTITFDNQEFLIRVIK